MTLGEKALRLFGHYRCLTDEALVVQVRGRGIKATDGEIIAAREELARAGDVRDSGKRYQWPRGTAARVVWSRR